MLPFLEELALVKSTYGPLRRLPHVSCTIGARLGSYLGPGVESGEIGDKGSRNMAVKAGASVRDGPFYRRVVRVVVPTGNWRYQPGADISGVG